MTGAPSVEQPTTRRDAPPISRGIELALCATALALAAVCYSIAGRAAAGLANRLHLLPLRGLLESFFLLFLLVIGLQALDRIATHGRYQAQVLPLPRREGNAREWAVGAALGWGLSLAAVLPVLVTANLHGSLSIGSARLFAFAADLAASLLAVLGQEVIFRGYALRRLGAAIGENFAALLLSVVFGVFLLQAARPASLFTAVLSGTLLGLLCTVAWKRTRALWLGWGLHFGYRAITGIVLGLPAAGRMEFGSLIDTYATGPRFLNGGSFGLDAAILTPVFLLLGIVVLYQVTREYAWHYTYEPAPPGGYPVTVAPPPAHVAMERAAAPPPLVQIATPAPPPPIPEREAFER